MFELFSNFIDARMYDNNRTIKRPCEMFRVRKKIYRETL